MENWTIEASRQAIEQEQPLIGPVYALGDETVSAKMYRVFEPGPILVTLVSPTGDRIRISGDREIERAFRAIDSKDQYLLDEVVASGTPL